MLYKEKCLVLVATGIFVVLASLFVVSALQVECASDADCRRLYGEGAICDLSADNFGNCISVGNENKNYCGDGVCQNFEDFNSCYEDCYNVRTNIKEDNNTFLIVTIGITIVVLLAILIIVLLRINKNKKQ